MLWFRAVQLWHGKGPYMAPTCIPQAAHCAGHMLQRAAPWDPSLMCGLYKWHEDPQAA